VKKLLIMLLLVLSALLAACGSGESPTSSTAELSVTATDIAFSTGRLEVVAGQPVKLTLVNEGALEHDFSIMTMPHTGEVMVDDADSEMAGHDMSGMAEEPEIHVAAPAGGQGTIEFAPSTPGEYTYFCTVPGHKEAGMVGTLVVTAP
jgi:uncharacterized cupredoxin-like copper-binding protein